MKAKVARTIVRAIRNWIESFGGDPEYHEPFLRSGAVGLRVIRECPRMTRYWLKDADPAMSCLWRAVVERPESLRLILGCLELSVGYFLYIKTLLKRVDHPEDLVDLDPVSVSAIKIACHAMSFSGLGTMAGGPIGGIDQAGKYDVGCRYDTGRIASRVDEARDLLSGDSLHPEVCTCLDFEEVVRDPGEALFYLDPSYYKAGPGLYQASFTHDDHVRLAGLLRVEDRPWLLSYDRHPVIEELYGGWASVREIPISYSINGAARATEWLISNRPLDPEDC